jgi:pimeloyl-ACP methyl ester carboxylesterase
MVRGFLMLLLAGAAAVGGVALFLIWPSLPWTDDGHPGRSAPLRAPGPETATVVLYVPGLEFDRAADDRNMPDAHTRRVFPQALRDLFAGSGEVAFSYSAPGEPFRDSQSRQAIEESVGVLDAHVRALVDASSAELVLVTHSFGGAVAAYWAATAPEALLERVRLVVTFASPLDGYSRVVEPFDAILSWLASDAGHDLTEQAVIAHMRHGVLRADFVQYANRPDLIVPPEIARTDGQFGAWRALTLTPGCRGRDFNHDCVLWQEDALVHLRATLGERSPLASGTAERAAPFGS